MSHAHFVTTNLSSTKGGIIMKKEVTYIPVGQTAIDVISSLGDSAKNAWLFLDFQAAVDLYLNSKPKQEKQLRQTHLFFGPKNSNFICIRTYPEKNQVGIAEWNQVLKISHPDVAFTIQPDDPEEIFFIKKRLP